MLNRLRLIINLKQIPKKETKFKKELKVHL